MGFRGYVVVGVSTSGIYKVCAELLPRLSKGLVFLKTSTALCSSSTENLIMESRKGALIAKDLHPKPERICSNYAPPFLLLKFLPSLDCESLITSPNDNPLTPQKRYSPDYMTILYCWSFYFGEGGYLRLPMNLQAEAEA